LRVLIAVGLIVAGVSLCAWAGKKKEQQTSFHFSMKSWSVRAGIVLCVLAGVGGSMINLGLVFGAPILEQASHHAVPEWHRTNALWLPLLLSGFGPTALYCSYRLQVNHTWGNYARLTVWSYWGLALLMGVLWFGSVEVYGVAAGWIGDWGPVLGWPVFLSTSIATANVWGILTGEWKEASPTARRIMRWGLALLIASIFILGFQSGRAQP
jgi:L-rhamnose-H+ transport protein